MPDEITTTGNLSFAVRTAGAPQARYTGDGEWFVACPHAGCGDWFIGHTRTEAHRAIDVHIKRCVLP